MITPNEIKHKAEKLYIPFLRSWLEDQEFFPRIIPSDKKVSEDLNKMSQEIGLLINNSKYIKGYGYKVILEQRRTSKNGLQSLPERIEFENQQDFLKFIGKSREFELFKQNVDLILQNIPELKEWIYENTNHVIQNYDKWTHIISVCKFFIANPKPNLYIRELEIEEIDTKFIEKNKVVLSSLFF